MSKRHKMNRSQTKKKRRQAKRKISNKPKVKQGCRDAMQDLERLRDLANDHGLTVRANEVHCRRGKRTYHFMFDHGDQRVLDYWPGTGRTYSPLSGEKGMVRDSWEALDEAARLSVPD